MKKILLLTNSKCGGAERVTITYGKLLYAHGYDVTVLIYCGDEVNTSCEIKNFIPSYIKVDYVFGQYRFLLFKLRRYLKNTDFKIIFSSLPLLNYINIILSKFVFRNRVAVIRECNTPSRHPNRIRFFNKLLYKFADILISQTDEMRNEMSELYRISTANIITVYNPIDVEQIECSIQEKIELPTNYTKYVAIGRVQLQKDYATLLLSFSKLLTIQPNSLLYIVGDDKSNYALKQKELVSELGIGDKVVFAGFQSNPYKYLYEADCFVLSSIFEGLPNVLLEAIYLGIPVVATASIPFIERTLNNEMYGRCVPVGNVDLLAQAMIDIAKRSKYIGCNITKDSFISFLNSLDLTVSRT